MKDVTVRVICDRCGKEIREGSIRIKRKVFVDLHSVLMTRGQEVDFDDLNGTERDLCSDCYREFKNWFKGGEKNE